MYRHWRLEDPYSEQKWLPYLRFSDNMKLIDDISALNDFFESMSEEAEREFYHTINRSSDLHTSLSLQSFHYPPEEDQESICDMKGVLKCEVWILKCEVWT